jgi:LPXTG-motif cell wall-anchored protein
MKKVYVLVAAIIATFGALSVGSATFAAPGDSVPVDSVPATNDTVPGTDSVPSTDSSTTTSTTVAPTTVAPTTTASTTTSTTIQTLQASTDSSTSTTASVLGVTVSSSDQVGQEAPTSTIRKVGSDGLLPNTGSDIAIPLILALLAAGTGAATLLVRRRSNIS